MGGADRGRVRRKHTADYTRTEDGRWHVRVKAVPGAEARGRTIKEARRKLGKVLARVAPEIDPEGIEYQIHLDAVSRRALRAYRAARKRVEREEAVLRKKGRGVARVLTEGEMGLSIRDTADLLDVSLGWVQQLLEEA